MKTKLFLGRPVDKSYRAYKKFISILSDHLGVAREDKVTEEELRQGWYEFWNKAKS